MHPASPLPLPDTLHPVETPEGVMLWLRPAGAVSRLLAGGLDMLFRALIFIVASMLLDHWGSLGTGLQLLLFFLLEWFYPVLFECLPGSATPGKRFLGLRVVMGSGLPVTLGASLLRNVLRAVDFLPTAYALGTLCMLLRPDCRRLGDLVADTLVVYRSAPGWQRAWPPGPAAAPARPLSAAQQAAILGLAERCERLSPERFNELAQLAHSVLPTELPPDTPAGERLLALARWLAGQRNDA